MACELVRVATPPPPRPAIGSGLPHLKVREQRKGQVVITPETEGKGQGRQAPLKDLALSPLSTRSIEWPPTGPPSEAYPLEVPQVYLPQGRHLHRHQVLRRVQPARRRVHKVREGSYAASGYPLRQSAVRHSEWFGVSSYNFENPLHHNGARARIRTRDFTASPKTIKMFKARRSTRPKSHWKTDRQ